MEDNGAKEIHPHFLLNEALLSEYQRTQASIFRSIEIQWQDQQLIFDSELRKWDTLPSMAGSMKKELWVLLSENKFSSLFQFYRAVLCDCSKLEDATREEARFEYSLFPSVYSSLIKNEKVLERLETT
jgi:hypothetical protein